VKKGRLFFQLVILLYLVRLLFFLVTDYFPSQHGFDPPLVISILDTINLFIHEAGHFFFKPFWMWLEILAGSLVQVLLPLALVIVTVRESPSWISLPGFWLGESMVNVSAYIKDAPYMKLKLIARGLIHDWNWLIGSNEETATLLGGAVFWLGILTIVASISFAVYSVVSDFRNLSAGKESTL
jgi:hypothetical protein